MFSELRESKISCFVYTLRVLCKKYFLSWNAETVASFINNDISFKIYIALFIFRLQITIVVLRDVFLNSEDVILFSLRK